MQDSSDEAQRHAKKVREKSRECHNHKPQPFPDPKRKRKPTNLNKHKPNKRTKSTKISSLFPKRGNRNTKRTEKHKNKMAHGKTYNKSPRRINHKATKSTTNTGTTALERSVEQKKVVLPTLLYECETWTVYQWYAKRLNHFHTSCLRKLLKIKWQDRIPDTEVLKRAGMQSVHTILKLTQLRWTGHVTRMPDERLPMRILYGELQVEKRSHGGQKKRYKDTLISHP